jgi:hypothetical protein
MATTIRQLYIDSLVRRAMRGAPGCQDWPIYCGRPDLCDLCFMIIQREVLKLWRADNGHS